jgi:hypothetical protein
MHDLTRSLPLFGQRRLLHLRCWGTTLHTARWYFLRWAKEKFLSARDPCTGRRLKLTYGVHPLVEFDWHVSPGHNGACYCPTGATTSLRIALLGCGVWLSVSRDWTRRPCHCDKVIWSIFPDRDNVENIQEYGVARLRAEYPHCFDDEAYHRATDKKKE